MVRPPDSGNLVGENSVKVKSVPPRVDPVDARGIKLLSLYGGVQREGESIEHFAALLGAEVRVYDLERGEDQNLADQAIWDGVVKDIEADVYDGASSAAPCGTFSASRKYDGGPPPLRGEHAPQQH